MAVKSPKEVSFCCLAMRQMAAQAQKQSGKEGQI